MSDHLILNNITQKWDDDDGKSQERFIWRPIFSKIEAKLQTIAMPHGHEWLLHNRNVRYRVKYTEL